MLINSWTDYHNFLKTFTIRRVVNALKVIVSFYLSRILKKPLVWGFPMSLSVEPTNQCNLGCTECPTGLQILTRKNGKLSFDLFKKIVDEIYRKTAYLTLYFQGEPYMNPQFTDLVAYASRKNMYTTTSTNAHYLTENNCRKTIESGLSRLIISIDGTTQDVYEHYRRGGNLSMVLEGTKRLTEMKRKMKARTPQVVLQFIVFKKNEHQVEDVKKLAKELGVDKLALKTAQVYNYEQAKDVIPENIKYSRYKKQKDGNYQIKSTFYNHCWRSWQSCVITWDGKLVPCCFDKDAAYAAGDVSKTTLKQVWQGNNLSAFKHRVLNQRKDIDICTNCTEGTKIWI